MATDKYLIIDLGTRYIVICYKPKALDKNKNKSCHFHLIANVYQPERYAAVFVGHFCD